jgi:hypothetical protein
MGESEVAKVQLREHLGSILIPPVAEGFWSIQSSAKEICERNRTPDQVIRTFQNMLTKIPEWSDVTLSTEVERIQKVTKCPYLEDLMMGVFISYMKSFASLHHGAGTEISIDFDRPTIGKFVHELYTQSARKLWQVAYLFKTAGVTSEYQARAHQEVETIINQSLEQVIRTFLPWESITKKYFATPSAPIEVSAVEEEKKGVSFGENEEEEFDVEDSEDESPPLLQISEEEATLDIPEEEELDPIKELEKKAEETLVLNL